MCVQVRACTLAHWYGPKRNQRTTLAQRQSNTSAPGHLCTCTHTSALTCMHRTSAAFRWRDADVHGRIKCCITKAAGTGAGAAQRQSIPTRHSVAGCAVEENNSGHFSSHATPVRRTTAAVGASQQSCYPSQGHHCSRRGITAAALPPSGAPQQLQGHHSSRATLVKDITAAVRLQSGASQQRHGQHSSRINPHAHAPITSAFGTLRACACACALLRSSAKTRDSAGGPCWKRLRTCCCACSTLRTHQPKHRGHSRRACRNEGRRCIWWMQSTHNVV